MLVVVWKRNGRVIRRIGGTLRRKKRAGKRGFSTSPYPFRPGYGLGSWIPPPVVTGMGIESAARAKIAMTEQILKDLESTARDLQLEMNSMQTDPDQAIPIPAGLSGYQDEITQARTDTWGKKIEALTELFNLQKGMADFGDPQLSPQSFNAGAASPVKWKSSEVAFVDRASDSLTVTARFFHFDKNSQNAKSHSLEVSHAAGSEVRAALGSDYGHKTASAIHDEVTKTLSQHDIESTLLLVAKATHAKVMQFNTLQVDELRLRDAWNFYHGGLGIGSEVWGGEESLRLDISTLTPMDLVPPKDDRQIYMVDECFMGSCLVGTVHFVKTEETEESQREGAVSTKRDVEMATLFGALSGDSSVAASAASTAVKLASQGRFDVKFNLMCLGYTPPLKSNDLVSTVKVFKDFDPANFKMDGDGQDDSSGDANSDEKTKAMGRREAVRQSNMKAVIQASIKGVAESMTMRVLDFTTFMSAFDDYCENAPKKDGVGIPIGLNVRAWGRHNIATLLWNKYIVGHAVAGVAETGEDDQQKDSTE